jgi:cytochrome P450
MAARDDAGDALSQEDIEDNVLTILFAGSDTTASATISLWKVLSLNPKLKSALRNAPSEAKERPLDKVL